MSSLPPTDLPRVALVTGAGRRIGRALALALAEDGFDLALHCHRSEDEAQDLLRAVQALGRRGLVLRADLAREAEVERVVPEAMAALGPLGLLVNNAAVFGLDHLATADRDSWDRHMEINLRAPLVLAQGLVAGLPAAAAGLIVNLIDQRVLNLTPNFLSYSISKAGLWAATQVLARQLAPRVRVNAIGPGPVLAAPGLDPAEFERLWRSTPLQRGTSLDELAQALRFIIASPSMTGQLITLDGGMQMGWLTPGIVPVD